MKKLLREIQYPAIVPADFPIFSSLWAQHGRDLITLMRRYPALFPDVPEESPVIKQEDTGVLHEKRCSTDTWGAVLVYGLGGLTGIRKTFPLEDWAALETYVPPDPLTKAEEGPRDDWEELRLACNRRNKEGRFSIYILGQFLERLLDLRGYDRYLMDLVEEPPQLPKLIEMVLSYNERLVAKCIECGVDIFQWNDDLGTQKQLMMSPGTFRKWLKPGYARLWKPIKSDGRYVALHSDGMILEILPDLIEIGLDIINPQVAVNGIDAIAEICKGRICIYANLDDQNIIPRGSPREIREHVREVIIKLGSPEGGLGLESKLMAPIPMENLEALFSSIEEFRTYWKK